jgi:hypothetical protein
VLFYGVKKGIFAKVPKVERESSEVINIEILARKNKHMVLKPSLADIGDELRSKFVAQIKTCDSGPAGSFDWCYVHLCRPAQVIEEYSGRYFGAETSLLKSQPNYTNSI